MVATTTTADFPLASAHPFDGGQENAAPDSPNDGNLAGASGTSSGGFELSRGGLIAIIIVVVVVLIFGIATMILFFVAKKREWTMRETIRKSARKVVTALTPRRSEFPRSVKESNGRGGRLKLDDVPPTPRLRPDQLELDLEKGSNKSGKTRKNFSHK
ncbi:hypothetical protein B0H63DRAFT_203895 [Podospora didyma]|uniref:Uncharacterized protein n=1 Tax=Podospora didyma TaxID=330526 RepID=A0AAE0NH12_9PEZI|nr:hypothetical protein B0H63DRAFT_203895 [Podospora didyma]